MLRCYISEKYLNMILNLNTSLSIAFSKSDEVIPGTCVMKPPCVMPSP